MSTGTRSTDVHPDALRPYLVGGLWASAILAAALLISLALWCVLGASGDAAGATVARVLTWLFGCGWLLNLWVLVALLIMQQIGSTGAGGGERGFSGDELE